MSKRKVITEEDVREVEKDLGKVIEKLELKKSQIRLVYRMFNSQLNPQLMQIQIC